MNETLVKVLRGVALGASLVATGVGFFVERNDANGLDNKLQEMRDIEERIKSMTNK